MCAVGYVVVLVIHKLMASVFVVKLVYISSWYKTYTSVSLNIQYKPLLTATGL